jgi:ABC-type sugar transport system substrate-binding protein
MARSRTRRAALATALAMAVGLGGGAGCQPPPPADSGDAGGAEPTSVVAGSKLITMLMPQPIANAELMIWRQVAMEEGGRQAAESGMVLEVQALGPTDPPAMQAEQVRAALAKGSAALIVVAADAKAVAPALVEARDKGVPVVLLGRPVPVEGQPFPRVAPGAFEPSARELVATAALVAKDRGIADKPALVVVKDPPDDHTEARVAALTTALAEAKVPLRATLHVTPYPEEAGGLISEELKARPDVSMILADEDQGFSGIGDALDRLGLQKPPAAAAFVYDPKFKSQVMFGNGAALVNPRVQALASRAVRVAVALVENKPPPDLVLNPELIRASDPVAAAREWLNASNKRRAVGH